MTPIEEHNWLSTLKKNTQIIKNGDEVELRIELPDVDRMKIKFNVEKFRQNLPYEEQYIEKFMLFTQHVKECEKKIFKK